MKTPSSETFHIQSPHDAAGPMTKCRIIKNVVVISIGAFVLFMSYDGLSMLQSTMNSEQGIGIMSQAVLYICFCISALIFPKYIIKKLGSKRTLVLSMLSYVPYVASNFYPHWSVMMPTSILIGFGAALLWGSQNNYLNDVSVLYAELLLSGNVEDENKKAPEDERKGFYTVNKHNLDNSRFVNGTHNGYGSVVCQMDNNQDQGAVARVLTTPENDNRPSNFDGHGEGHYESFSECRYSCEERFDGYRNSERINDKCSSSRKESSIRKDETEIEEHTTGCGNNTDGKHIDPTRKHSIPHVPNDSTGILYTNRDVMEIDSNRFPGLSMSARYLDDKKCHSHQICSVRPVDSGRTLYQERDLNMKCSKNNREQVVSSTTARFFGFHGMLFHSSAMWSNLISYYVLQSRNSDAGNSSVGNSSVGNSSGCVCGAGFLDSCFRQEQTGDLPSDAARYALSGVCVCLGLASVLVVALFLDPLDDRKKDEDDDKEFSLRMLTATLRLAKRTDLVLLMPLSLYQGMSQGFFISDITKAFVSCAWGAQHVGLVAASFGAACALSSVLSGLLVKRLGRPTIFAAAALLNICSCAFLLTWTPNHDHPILFFVASVMWGMFVGTIHTQIRAFYGVLFKADEEAAFATFNTWNSLGFFISFVYSNVVLVYIKIYLLFAVSTVGFVGYFAVERRHYSHDKATRPDKK